MIMMMNKLVKVLMCVTALTVFMVGCGSTDITPITVSDFDEIAEAADYYVAHDTDLEKEYSEIVNGVSIAMDNSLLPNYQVDFFDFKNVESAQNAYVGNRDKVEALKGNVSTSSKLEVGNICTYQLTTNGTYYVVIQVENTLVYADVAEDYKDEVQALLESIGYLK